MRPYLNPFVLSTVLLMLVNCRQQDTGATTPLIPEQSAQASDVYISKQQFKSAGMTLGSIGQRKFPETIQATGLLDVPPQNRAIVTATMGGYIHNVPLLIGDHVNKGQVLLTIQNPAFVQLQQEYMETKEQLDYLKQEYDRHQTMRAENITSQKSFLKAQSQYKTTLARYNGLHKQLQLLHIQPSQVESGNIVSMVPIYAPITGTITQLNISLGTYVSPSNPILEIINNDHLHLELSVFEKDVLKLTKGQEILFKIPEASPDTYTGSVHLIGTSLQPNRTIKVHGHIDQVPDQLITGMFIDALIVIDHAFAKALPQTAITTRDQTQHILQLVNNDDQGYYFKSVPVITGDQFDDYIAITNTANLDPNARYLTHGVYQLTNTSSSSSHNH